MKKTKRKAFNFLRSYFDTLNELKEDKDKIQFLEAIINKQFLDEEPKDLTFLANLCYQSQRHQIESSVKGYKTKSKDPMQGATQGATEGACQGATQGASVQEEEKEKEKEKEKEEYTIEKKPKKFSFAKELINLGGEESLVQDWLMVRKNKRATNTKTALNNFISQVKKSGNDLNYVLTLCVSNSWSSFNHKWNYDGKTTNAQVIKKQQRRNIVF